MFTSCEVDLLDIKFNAKSFGCYQNGGTRWWSIQIVKINSHFDAKFICHSFLCVYLKLNSYDDIKNLQPKIVAIKYFTYVFLNRIGIGTQRKYDLCKTAHSTKTFCKLNIESRKPAIYITID